MRTGNFWGSHPLTTEQEAAIVERCVQLGTRWGLFAVTRESYVTQLAFCLEQLGLGHEEVRKYIFDMLGNGHAIKQEACALFLDEAFAKKAYDSAKEQVKNIIVGRLDHFIEKIT